MIIYDVFLEKVGLYQANICALLSGHLNMILKWMFVPIVPVWVDFSGLPVHFHHQEALFQIVRMIGIPMKLYNATAENTRPYVARVCVEIDISQELPYRVFIKVSNHCISQSVVYEDLPLYCTTCSRLGHQTDTCWKDSVEDPPHTTTTVTKTKPPAKEKMQRWTPKKSDNNVRQEVNDVQ